MSMLPRFARLCQKALSRWARLRQAPVRSEMGMSLVEILIVLAIIGLVAGMFGYGAYKRFEDSKRTTTIGQIEGLVASYNAWKLTHTGQPCPNNLYELVDTTLQPGQKDAATGRELLPPQLKDGWGQLLKYNCDSNLHGTDRFEAYSIGKDGQENTADDIKSWDPATMQK